MITGLVTKGGGSLGGASRIAIELASALLKRGAEARLFCYRPTPASGVSAMLAPQGVAAKISRHLDWRLERLGATRRLTWEAGSLDSLGASACEVLHFHDVFECTSPRLLQRLSRKQPVFLTVHDCSPFTGGCLYPLDCRKFEKACGQCPQRERIGRFDFTRANIKLRRRAAGSGNLHFIFPSRWIQSEAEKSLAIEGRSHLIPNGFDSAPYRFPTRSEARHRLGLSPQEKVVLIGAHSLVNPYKGAEFALGALRSVADHNPAALVLGHPSPELENVLKGMRVVAPGFVSEKSHLANYYAAADLLLFPSLADNLPIMIQESMAAGTPVLAFDTGGIPELIDHGKTGWLVERGSQDALNFALRRVLVEGVPADMRVAARDSIQRRFAMEEFVSRHLDLYREVKESRQ